MTTRRIARRQAWSRSGVCLLLAFWLLAAAPTPAPAPWGPLNDWVGKYPTDDTARPSRKLLQIPAIRNELRSLLAPADLTRLAGLAVEQPLEMIDGLLIAAQCMPHDCGNQNALIVMDPKQRRMWVGFFSRSSSVVSTRWFGSTNHLDLPAAILGKFNSQHQP